MSLSLSLVFSSEEDEEEGRGIPKVEAKEVGRRRPLIPPARARRERVAERGGRRRWRRRRWRRGGGGGKEEVVDILWSSVWGLFSLFNFFCFPQVR